jgi:DNA-binding MarR family transcriptional regulator
MPERSPFKFQRADDSPGCLLFKLTTLWQRRPAEVFDQLGITQTQYAILASLRWFEEQEEPPSQAHLVAHAKIDKMTLSKAIRRLEENGLVRRVASATDSRAVDVGFTPKGRRVVEQAVVAVERADDEFFDVVPARRVEEFKSLTREIIAGNSETARTR